MLVMRTFKVDLFDMRFATTTNAMDNHLPAGWSQIPLGYASYFGTQNGGGTPAAGSIDLSTTRFRFATRPPRPTCR